MTVEELRKRFNKDAICEIVQKQTNLTCDAYQQGWQDGGVTMTREQQIYKKAEGDCIAMLESIERGDIIKGSICPQSYRAGFMDGAKWADQYPQWIPVEERLPEENGKTQQSVSVWATNGLITCEMRYNFDTKTWTDMWGDPFDITHWMSLPQPPRKEE